MLYFPPSPPQPFDGALSPEMLPVPLWLAFWPLLVLAFKASPASGLDSAALFMESIA